VVLHEPHGVEAHLVGQHALLEGLFDHRVVVDDRSLHLVGETQSHATFLSGLPDRGAMMAW
jgi:hypothetical protein